MSCGFGRGDKISIWRIVIETCIVGPKHCTRSSSVVNTNRVCSGPIAIEFDSRIML